MTLECKDRLLNIRPQRKSRGFRNLRSLCVLLLSIQCRNQHAQHGTESLRITHENDLTVLLAVVRALFLGPTPASRMRTSPRDEEGSRKPLKTMKTKHQAPR
jgi:hypothetical protein